MDGRVYVSHFRKIGPVMIRITNNSALLLSALGTRSYGFGHMPSNYDNKYAILKLAMKHYFAEMVDACETLGARRRQTPVSQILGFFFSKPQLTHGGNTHEMLCCEIHSSPRHYNWEDVDGFREYKGTEDILRCLQKRPVVRFSGFEDGFLADPESLAVTEREMDRLQTESKPDGGCAAIISYFLSNEIGYLTKMQDYKSRLVQDEKVAARGIDLSCFLEIIRAHETLLKRFVARFSLRGLAAEKSDLLRGGSAEIAHAMAAKGEADGVECSIPNISAFLNENFDLFLSYEGFMAEFDDIMERNAELAGLRDCFTTVIQKITGYSQVCRSFLRHQSSRETKLVYLRFLKYNRRLNRIAENIYLRNTRHRLLERCAFTGSAGHREGTAFRRSRLLARISCQADGGTDISICVFDGFVSFFRGEFEYIAHTGLETVDMHVFDRKVFLFVECDDFRSTLFKKTGASGLWSLVLHYTSKESVNEFVEVFYRTKYDAEPFEGMYCHQKDGTPYDILVTNVSGPGRAGGVVSLVGTAPPQDRLYDVMIEQNDLQIGGTSQLTEKEINSRVKKLFEGKIDHQARSAGFLVKLRIMLENISKTRLAEASLHAYNEDDVPFREKESVFHHFIEMLGSRLQTQGDACRDVPGAGAGAAAGDPQTQRDRFYSSLLYEKDILKHYCPGDVVTHLTQYILVLNGGSKSRHVLKNADLNTTALLFAMFWQRNLYAFLSPEDLLRIALCVQGCDYQGIATCVSGRNRPYLSKVMDVCRAAYQRDRRLARVMLIPLFGGDVTDHVLHKVLNAC